MEPEEAAQVIDKICRHYGLNGSPDGIGYEGETPYQILVATIISQQTTERNGRKATEALLSEYPGPYEMMGADVSRVEELIYCSRFCRQKAEGIIGATRIIVEEYGGEVPRDIDVLMSLPMVGKKTAACVMRYGFGVRSVIVDTHIARVSRRLGISESCDPGRIQQDIADTVPPELWDGLDGAFITLGRDVCRPSNPECNRCPVNAFCRAAGCDPSSGSSNRDLSPSFP